MTGRYPAPYAEQIWSDEGRISRLRQASDLYTAEAIRRGLLGPREEGWAEYALAVVRGAGDPTAELWRDCEDHHGHEIVGFLDAYLERLPEEIRPYVHYGLTSSDLVEFDLHKALDDHAVEMHDEVAALIRVMHSRVQKHRDAPRAGRTHGQTAELTTLGHQFQVFLDTLRRLARDLVALDVLPIKSPGPTGASDEIRHPWEGSVVPSTQIIPRDYLLRWAAVYLNLSNALETMAMFVRTGSRSEIGEFREGLADSRQGSSAMPGKANPIDSEKVCGLARIARGHFLALAEVSALWEDRDLSNSSTERLAVPGLAATVEHMLSTVTRVFEDLEVDRTAVELNSMDARCTANARQMQIQKTQRVGPIEASRLATEKRNT